MQFPHFLLLFMNFAQKLKVLFFDFLKIRSRPKGLKLLGNDSVLVSESSKLFVEMGKNFADVDEPLLPNEGTLRIFLRRWGQGEIVLKTRLRRWARVVIMPKASVRKGDAGSSVNGTPWMNRAPDIVAHCRLIRDSCRRAARPGQLHLGRDRGVGNHPLIL